MKLTLSENIRRFRKEQKMTQEKLAEALGVTVGAVYKWESGLSLPELNLIVEIADFFDVSVDVLLGYQMQDNRVKATIDRLAEYCRSGDRAALTEAEKALAKYPHSFELVYACAGIYLGFGASYKEPALLKRSLELMEQSLVLLPQNTDPRINEAVIYGDMAIGLNLLDEKEKCLELMKKNNAGGIFNCHIGISLVQDMKQPEEAVPFLSEALLNSLSNLLTTILGYLFLFRSRNDWDSALAILHLGIDLLRGMRKETVPDALDKTLAEMLAVLAYVQAKTGRSDLSDSSLKEAAAIARRFDSMPDYSLKTMRFADFKNQITIFDIYGVTAAESVADLISQLEDPEFSDRWKELMDHEE